MAIFKGQAGSMSSGHFVTRLPLIKRGAVEIGETTIGNLILPQSIDARLENVYNGEEVTLYTGRFILNRLAVSAKIKDKSVFMGFFTFFIINLILIPLFFATSFVVIMMGLFFSGLGDNAGLDPFVLYGGITWATLGILRILSNFKSYFMLG